MLFPAEFYVVYIHTHCKIPYLIDKALIIFNCGQDSATLSTT